jgi:plasmid stabilization system protein ParE
VAYVVELHPGALAEAEKAVAWYAQRNAHAAVAFARAVSHAIDLISESPERWPVYLEGTRRILVERFPFQLVYRVGGTRVLVVAVAHGRRRPGYWASLK